MEDGVLSITKEAAYEAALWLPLLEKAYAKFQDQWGAYGEDKDNLEACKRADMENKGFSEEQLDFGYELLHWGASAKMYPLFFGDAVNWDYHTTQTESGNMDFVDSPLLKTLLELQGVGLEEGQELYLDTITQTANQNADWNKTKRALPKNQTKPTHTNRLIFTTNKSWPCRCRANHEMMYAYSSIAVDHCLCVGTAYVFSTVQP